MKQQKTLTTAQTIPRTVQKTQLQILATAIPDQTIQTQEITTPRTAIPRITIPKTTTQTLKTATKTAHLIQNQAHAEILQAATLILTNINMNQ